MIRMYVWLLVLVLVGCGGGDFTSEGGDGDGDLLGNDLEPTGGSEGDGDGDDPLGTPDTGGSSTGGAQGGSGGLATGGDPSTGGVPAGGTGGEPGGSGGSPGVEHSCHPYWDETVEYSQGDLVQVEDTIFRACNGAPVGTEPSEQAGHDFCHFGWVKEAMCPSINCADARVWDTENSMYFDLPLLAGELFLHEGQIWELQNDDVTYIHSEACPPNPDPEHWCAGPGVHTVQGSDELVTFELAEQCL